jgi:hypothetical protein
MLEAAGKAGRGVTTELEGAVREHARARREAGEPISRVLIDLKTLVRAYIGRDEAIFTPKVVGWAVAGYFAGTSQSE